MVGQKSKKRGRNKKITENGEWKNGKSQIAD